MSAPALPTTVDGAPLVLSVEVVWSRERIVAAIHEHVRVHGCAPSPEDWRRANALHPHLSTVQRRFGSWSAGLAAAGVEGKPRGGWREGRSRVPWTRERVVMALRRWALVHDRVPRAIDVVGDRSLPSVTAVEGRFGSWNAGLSAAGLAPRPRKGGRRG